LGVCKKKLVLYTYKAGFMDETRFIELLSKKRSGAITLLEQKELNDLIQSDPRYAEMAGTIDNLYKVSDNKIADPEAHQKLWSSIQSRLHTEEQSGRDARKGTGRWISIVSVAASVLAIVAFVAVFYARRSGTEEQHNIVSTKKGNKTKIVLPDGSEVWLNSDSKISYNALFGKHYREVTLEGEAFFDVKKDPDHPFTVLTKEMSVKVLGTAFDVRAYPGESNEQTTLIHGAVEVTLKRYGNKRIELAPYEKIAVSTAVPATGSGNTGNNLLQNSGSVRLSKIKNDTASSVLETQWVKNTLAFEDKPFGKIALEIERWYDVKVLIRKDQLTDKRFNGVFNDRPLDEVLEALSLAGNFHFKIENRTVTIY
jgi:ferric-dicitrate binding protein FerR (iron transport regulator)